MNFSNAIALVALAILVPAVDLTAQRPGFANGGNSMSTSRVVSPAVVASWVSHESFADRTVTSLLVLWRGTPGWFLKGRGGSGGAGASGGGEGGASAYVYFSEGGLSFVMEFDYDKKTVKMLNQEISLKETNVVLVDFVDSANGPEIVGNRWVDATLFESRAPADPIPTVVKQTPELFEYLRCDVELSEPVMKTWMPVICGQMRP